MVIRNILLCGLIASFSQVSGANEQRIINAQYDDAIERGRDYLTSEFIDDMTAKYEATYESEGRTHKESSSFVDVQSVDNTITHKILISDAMGSGDLRHLLSSLEHNNNVTFVVRGLLPSEKTITDVGIRIVNLIKNLDYVPNIQLDPRPFQDVHAKVAPQILTYRGDELILSATGLANPQYMTEQIEKGKTGDLGNFGTVVNISERDITEVIKERMANLDQDKLIADAKDRFWENMQFLSLPKRSESLVREFEPVVTIQDDVIAPNGAVIVLRGQQFNTLERAPFTMRLVIFDATDKKQLEYAKSLPPSHLRTKFITTRFDTSLKWDAIKSVESELNAPIFQLKSEIIQAFDLQSVPTIVTADNLRKVFIISEIGDDLL